MATHTTTRERSAGEIMQDVLRDVGDVVRGEVRLARAEIGEKARKAGAAGGWLGAAAAFGFLGLASLVAAGVAALSLFMPVWLAALAMGLFLGSVGGAAYGFGRSKLEAVDPTPERTVQTIKDDIQWAKHRTT